MYAGKLVFSQVMEHLPLHVFHRCVERYNGDFKVKEFTCLDHYLCMAFAQLTYRESLRDIEACLRAQKNKLYHMGMTGERIAEKYGITREKADEFSLYSQRKAADAENNGNFSREIVPVSIGECLFNRAECIREDTTIDKLAALPPAFKENGILTAGNSSKLSDGAAAVVVASAEKASQLGIKPLCTIVDYTAAGTLPEDVMEAPIPAVRKLLKKTGFTIDDMDLFEHNEAYSSASIAVALELDVDPARFNIRGGAVALGHPLGASGARVLVTLIHALRDKELKRGLATLCLGGGNAVAMIVENNY